MKQLLLTAAILQISAVMALQAQVTFAPEQTYPTGNNPSSVAVGDFNGDGKADLVVANIYSNPVSVLLNKANGTGTFNSATAYATGGYTYAVAVGDFNGDGKPDLATANYNTNTVSVLLNKADGTGTFNAQVAYPLDGAATSVAVGDFNGDGAPDLVTANNGNNTVSVLLNKANGTGAFHVQVAYPTGNYPYFVTVGDFNGDGKADLVVANGSSNSISVLMNKADGTGTFSPQVMYPVGANPSSVAVGDFNGDGKPDLAVTNRSSNTVSTLLNKADGTGVFNTPSAYVVGTTPESVAADDFNGDGAPDLVTANNGNNTVSVLLNKADGTGAFNVQVTYPGGANPKCIASGDFNGDGRSDLATANYLGNTTSVLLNTTVLPYKYVTQDALSTGSGSSWADPVDLQTALNTAGPGSIVFVAKGRYYPTGSQSGTDRNATFLIPQQGGIKIYGGYPVGGGIRNVKANPTILSGDIGIPGNNNDNSYHVMVMTGAPAGADSVVIDGFTIRDGNANSTGSPYTYNGNATNQNEGGGILLRLNNNINKVAIRNCITTDNAASAGAGGIYVWQTAPTVINSLIAHNATAGNGGGLFLYEAPGLLLVNSTVAGNTAGGDGNSVYNTGASSMKVANSILWSNDAAKNVFNDATLIVNYSDVRQASGVYTGINNINADPLFANPSAGDYSLISGSPAMNTGSNVLFTGLDANTNDLAGNARLVGAVIDMGAYEYDAVLPVLFGKFSAIFRNGQLIVDWRTETETNNDHFFIQVSADGRNWKAIQTVPSKAPGGNSTGGLNYSSTIPLAGLSMSAGLLLLGVMARRRRSVFAIGTIVLFALSLSCSKKDIHNDMENGKLFVRIVQVDKNGGARISKVIQAVREN